jgi:16S rRNA (guanine527-N7)-methyltransferase
MFHVKHQGWARDRRAVGTNLTPEQLEALSSFEELLRSVAVPRGMVGARDAARLWTRHILDSVRAASEIPGAARVGDLGSGAGLPGVPLAVAVPNASFVLIEPRRARAAFLESVAADLRLKNVEVRMAPADRVADRFDAVVARAVSSAAGTWRLAEPLLERSGRLIYWAGGTFDAHELQGMGVAYRVSTHPDLAEAGPLVIMTRQ